MTTDKKTANAMGGKTARACDNCLHRRARWYCAADDAFLCQACDSSVHTANHLARRHERVRLQAASCKNEDSVGQTSLPAWHQGFARKARSPRNVKRKFPTPPQLVPEIGSEEASPADDFEEQFLYQVPTFDPFVAELNSHGVPEIGMENDSNPLSDYGCEEICDLDSLTGFLPSEMDLAEFAADVESYLGARRDEDVDTLKNIKEEQVETEANFLLDTELDMAKELVAWNLMEDEEEQGEKRVDAVEMSRKISLSLNYEDVIAAWASQGSPWTTGNRPEFDPNDYWPNCMVIISVTQTSNPIELKAHMLLKYLFVAGRFPNPKLLGFRFIKYFNNCLHIRPLKYELKCNRTKNYLTINRTSHSRFNKDLIHMNRSN